MPFKLNDAVGILLDDRLRVEAATAPPGRHGTNVYDGRRARFLSHIIDYAFFLNLSTMIETFSENTYCFLSDPFKSHSVKDDKIWN